jgi:hypothetical protein
MGLSKLTLYEIAGNQDDIVVDVGGPAKDNGLFVGWITRGERHNYKPLLNTDPIFKTEKLAKHFMQGIVDFAKKFTENDLTSEAIKNPEHPLHFFTLNQDELNVIQDITSAAKC